MRTLASGRSELYLVPIDAPGQLRAATSTGAQGRPTWLDDGRVLYVAGDNSIRELRISLDGGEPEIGASQRILAHCDVGERHLTCSRDGKKILAAVPLEGPPKRTVTLVQGWTAAVEIE